MTFLTFEGSAECYRRGAFNTEADIIGKFLLKETFLTKWGQISPGRSDAGEEAWSPSRPALAVTTVVVTFRPRLALR